jgi:UDP-N-acetylmuramate--alanine ligase
MQSRTVALAKEFQKALQKADKSFLLDIFASARDEKRIITSQKLAEGTSVEYLSEDRIKAELKDQIQKGDVIITAGAGDIYKIHYDIISAIKAIV